jgi:hypothetical protein
VTAVRAGAVLDVADQIRPSASSAAVAAGSGSCPAARHARRPRVVHSIGAHGSAGRAACTTIVLAGRAFALLALPALANVSGPRSSLAARRDTVASWSRLSVWNHATTAPPIAIAGAANTLCALVLQIFGRALLHANARHTLLARGAVAVGAASAGAAAGRGRNAFCSARLEGRAALGRRTAVVQAGPAARAFIVIAARAGGDTGSVAGTLVARVIRRCTCAIGGRYGRRTIHQRRPVLREVVAGHVGGRVVHVIDRDGVTCEIRERISPGGLRCRIFVVSTSRPIGALFAVLSRAAPSLGMLSARRQLERVPASDREQAEGERGDGACSPADLHTWLAKNHAQHPITPRGGSPRLVSAPRA